MTALRLKFFVLGMLLFYQAELSALSSDRGKKIFMEADRVELDDRQGVGRYHGQVRFKQGSIELTAAEVIVRRQAGKIHTLEALGQPVHFRQQLDGDEGEMRAQAQRMEYIESEDRLRLYGGAELWQGGDHFAGDYMEYDLRQETVMARGDEESEQRVRIVIQPPVSQPEVSP